MVPGPIIIRRPHRRIARMETDMAKGQKRSNKEVKKPKADKKPAAVAAPSPFAKAGPAPTGGKKKR
jgi:hypothetical protein